MKFPRHSFVRFNETTGTWAGHIGCIIGYDKRKKKGPYKVSVLPDDDLATIGIVTVGVREDQLERFDGKPGPKAEAEAAAAEAKGKAA